MTITYDTYADMFTDYDGLIENENYDYECRIIEVPIAWASTWVHRNREMTLNEFWDEYTYDDTIQMYEDAIKDGVLIREWTTDERDEEVG